MKVAFIGNQGGRDVYAFYAAMAKVLIDDFGASCRFAVWPGASVPMSLVTVFQSRLFSFEEYVRDTPVVGDADIDRLVRDYREVNWLEVVAAERLTDYSMLLGASGQRSESPEYSRSCCCNCPFSGASFRRLQRDGLSDGRYTFSLIAFKVARHLGISAYSIAPAWLLELVRRWFLRLQRVSGVRANDALVCLRSATPLTNEERTRVEMLIQSIRGFDGKTAYNITTSRQDGRSPRVVS